MSFFLAQTWKACVWLTAAMTVAAGMPHFVCRCPDRRAGQLAAGDESKQAGCCCGGCGCCNLGENTGYCAESAHAALAAHALPNGEWIKDADADSVAKAIGAIKRPQCVRAPLELATLVVPKTRAQDLKLVVVDTLPQETKSLFHAFPDHNQLIWSCERVPPPTDRVIVLQHFLI